MVACVPLSAKIMKIMCRMLAGKAMGKVGLVLSKREWMEFTRRLSVNDCLFPNENVSLSAAKTVSII